MSRTQKSNSDRSRGVTLNLAQGAKKLVSVNDMFLFINRCLPQGSRPRSFAKVKLQKRDSLEQATVSLLCSPVCQGPPLGAPGSVSLCWQHESRAGRGCGSLLTWCSCVSLEGCCPCPYQNCPVAVKDSFWEDCQVLGLFSFLTGGF